MNAEAKEKPVIGISIGDLNGIGPEIIIKTFSEPKMLQYCTPVIYGSLSTLNFHRKSFDSKNFNVNQIQDARDAHPRKVNLINCWNENVRIDYGQPSSEAGKYAFMSLQQLVRDAKSGLLDAIVTAPIDKFNIQSDQFSFPGHTEYLTQEFRGRDALMFLTGEHFRIGVVTGHIPLSQVAGAITKEKVLHKIRMMDESLRIDFGIRKPRIAVLGLNPHAGENGLLGNEEKEIILPAIEQAKDHDDILAMGPYPADGFFGTHLYRSFDGILAMYHDQGLVPFKMLHFESGVNFTAGLSIVRTSPDHGTGYAIAGKDMANEQSFREAVFLACQVLKNREMHAELTKKPLQSQLIKEKEI